MLACQEGHVEIVKILLDHGADVNAVDNEGKTSLIYAAICARDGFVEEEFEEARDICKLLVHAGADPSVHDKEGNSALDYANLSESRLVSDFLVSLEDL